MKSTPRFLQGVYPITGEGLAKPGPIDPALRYTVPDGLSAQALYFRGGNSTGELVYVLLVRDGEPMRWFPIGAKGDVHVPAAGGRGPARRHRRRAARRGARGRHRRARRRPRAGGGLMTAVLGGRPEGLTALHLDDDEFDTRARLVVVGNGMAGARFVEEVLERGGGDQFRITVFGDEPHGNYNRIMLSPVLAGEEHEDDIVLNSHDWYADNGVTLRAGVRAERIDTAAKLVHADDGTVTPYDHLVLATGSYSFIPPMKGVRTDDGDLLPGVYGFRTIDETRAMLAAAGRCTAGRRHGRRPARPGGRPRAAGPRPARRARARHALPDERAARRRGRRDPQEERRVARHHRAPRRLRHRGDRRPTACEGVGLADGRRIDADLLVVAAGVRPHTDIAVRSGLEVERGIVVDDQLRTDDPDVYAIGECAQHRGEVYGLVAPAWEHAKVLADVLTGTDPDAEYHGSRTATKLKVAGVDVAVMGINTPERDDDEFLVISEPRRGVHLSVVIRDDKLVGATLLGDTRKVAFLTQAFDRGRAAARGADPAARRPLRRRRGGRRRRDARRLAGLQLQRRLQGRHLRRGRRRLRQRRRGHGPHPRRQGLRLVQVAGQADRRVGRRRRPRRGPRRVLVRARHPDGQAGAHGRHPRAGPAQRLRRLRRARPGRQATTPSRRWA